MSLRIHIVGAGVSGLIAAIELEKKGYSCTIYDASDVIGGRVKTDLIDGYPYDHGFQVLLTEYPATKEWLDVSTLRLKKFRPGAEVVTPSHTSIIGDPRRDLKFWKSVFDPSLATMGDKIKTLKLAQELKSKSIEDIFKSPSVSSIEYLRHRGFSNKLIDQFFRPFWGGIFLETELTTDSKILEFVYKMFGEGYSAVPEKGMQEISNQLFAQLKNTELQLNNKVKKISQHEISLTNGQVISAEKIIVAADPSEILEGYPKTQWKSCYNYYFDVEVNREPNRMISLIGDASYYINNFHYPTDLSPHPLGKTILSATVINHGGHSIDQLRSKVMSELIVSTKCTRITPIIDYRIAHALPIVADATYSTPSNQIKYNNNVYLAGDHLNMGSLNAAMISGQKAAYALINSLT